MLNILDCTLRDGGYYNNWKFNPKLVENYLRAMEECSINYVELGFRFNATDTSLGPFATSKESFLDTLNLPSSLKYAVMINGKEFLSPDEQEIFNLIHRTFIPAKDSSISMVRLAINFDDVLQTKFILSCLKELGYKVGLNLMQASGKKESLYIETSSAIHSWGLVDVLYFADSFGNMDPEEISRIVHGLKKGWKGELGFHSHNNKGFALSNSLKAIDEGITYCDCTVTGMGRGAGNVTTESLLMELDNKNLIEVDLSLLQGTVSDFSELKSKYGWGPNMHYQYAANHNIHPTFVQTLSEDNRYDQYQSFKILEALAKEGGSSSFSHDSLRKVVYKDEGNNTGSWDPAGFLQDEEVLLIGGGNSVEVYKDEIINYIKNHNLKVIFLNLNKHIPQEMGVATIVSHEIRAYLDASFYSKLPHPLIIPMKTLGRLIKKYLNNVKFLDYGLNLQEGTMKIGKKACTLSSSVVVGYALAVCTRAGAKKINLVGFDGYHQQDIRFQEMEEIFASYKQLKESIDIVSLTPTNYSLNTEIIDGK